MRSSGNDKSIVAIHYNYRSFKRVCRGLRPVGELQDIYESCFGNGYGINAAPGINTDAGKN